MIRRRVIVSGRVQGVFYRESCRRQAQQEGIAGWVRNEPDGTVVAVLEGSREAVEGMVTWMGQGPRHALVAEVVVRSEAPEGERGFTVR